MTLWILSKNKFHFPGLFGLFICGNYVPGVAQTQDPDPQIDRRCKVCHKKVCMGRVPK